MRDARLTRKLWKSKLQGSRKHFSLTAFFANVEYLIDLGPFTAATFYRTPNHTSDHDACDVPNKNCSKREVKLFHNSPYKRKGGEVI
jgi:hypothetical protein